MVFTVGITKSSLFHCHALTSSRSAPTAPGIGSLTTLQVRRMQHNTRHRDVIIQAESEVLHLGLAILTGSHLEKDSYVRIDLIYFAGQWSHTCDISIAFASS